jgi:hypothetical protein
MSAPRLIVVAGVPVKSHEEITYRWTFALFWANFTYFIYRCTIYNEQNQLLSVCFSFIVCGVCLPLYGYNAVKKNKKAVVRFFTVVLAIISLFGIVSALSSIGFYYELSDMCDDCEHVFENGEQNCNVSFVKNEVLYVTDDECSKIPAESTFITEHVLNLTVNIIGMITACTVTVKRKHMQIVETVPTLLSTDTPVSVTTVEGETCVVYTEDVSAPV